MAIENREETSWIEVFSRMATTVATMTATLEKFDSTIRKIPDGHVALNTELKTMTTSVVELQTALENYMGSRNHDTTQIQRTIDKLHEGVEKLGEIVRVFDPSVSVGNRQILTEIKGILGTDVDSRDTMKTIKMLIHSGNEIVKEMNIVLRSKNETFAPMDLYEVVKFAKTGNDIIKWSIEKSKAIKAALVIIGLTISLPSIVTTVLLVWDVLKAAKH